MKYSEFLETKRQLDGNHGFEPEYMPDFLFDFQKSLVEWATLKGRGAIFADCGLGKTPMQLVWAQNVINKTAGKVLIVTPLAVSYQTIREAEKFNIGATRSDDGKAHNGITVTNYEKLHLFNTDDFVGTVCDESSAIKNFAGHRRAVVTRFMKKQKYRHLCTATAAPNDYIELGTSSEALGYLGHIDMLGRFFKNEQNSTAVGGSGGGGRFGPRPKWRFKGHAQQDFWRWVSSWARAMRKPSDLGFDDSRFELPPLIEVEHLVKSRTIKEGELFDFPAQGLHEQREEQRRTLPERCEMAAEIIKTHKISIAWCHLNDEGDLLEKLIPNSVQVSGSDSIRYKEAAIEWFLGDHCICNDPVFRSKLATWQKGERIIGGTIIGDIGSSVLLSPKDTKKEIVKSEKNICPNITEPIKKSTLEQKTKMPSEIAKDAKNMRTIKSSEKPKSKKQANIESDTQGKDFPENSKGMDSQLKITTDLHQKDVLSVDRQNREESGDSILTTITKAENSEGCSARSVTSGLENLETIQKSLIAPHCICGYVSGIRRLISKPRIFGWGLNLQHCAHMTFFPSHSYEAYYQAVRRSWRFGQKRPVTIDLITTEGGSGIMKNIQRKREQADEMFTELIAHMNDALSIESVKNGKIDINLPEWI